MGWNTLKILENHDKVFHPKFDGQHVYFVHSFAVGIGPHTIAESHHGISFSAAVKFRNYYGMQFHPEKSAKIGSDILKGFLKL
jgi:glutamine amidotransferase